VLDTVAGLGPVERLLADSSVEEIVATRFDLVFTYHSDGACRPVSERVWSSDGELDTWVRHLAATAGRTERRFDGAAPLLVMRLGSGLRLAATRDVSEHVSFALRRNTLGPVTLADLEHRTMFAPAVGELLAAFMRSTEMRVVASGATGSGKTTLLRALLAEAAPLCRLAVIEDTAELDVFDERRHPNVESWEAREANIEGEGAISQGRLVKHALRYRPDWLVCGEVRDSDAAVPMLKAMTHGQSSLTTVHAFSAVGALDKLALYLATGEDRLPIDAAHNQLWQAVDFVVHLDRLPDGRRVVREIVEVAGYDNGHCTTNTIFEIDDLGVGHTYQRLRPDHKVKLNRAGFDERRLGGLWGAA
jgi:Flp pilus assembly CpaF family ATPase